MNTRLTKMDWHVINAALALLETTPQDYGTEAAADRFADAIEVVRAKVWERIRDGYEERDRRFNRLYRDSD